MLVVIANIYVPLWPFGVTFIALCLGPDAIAWVRHQCRLRELWRDVSERESLDAETGDSFPVPSPESGLSVAASAFGVGRLGAGSRSLTSLCAGERTGPGETAVLAGTDSPWDMDGAA